jgi:hypothetical protein
MTLPALLFILMKLQRSPETVHGLPQNEKVEVKVEVERRFLFEL